MSPPDQGAAEGAGAELTLEELGARIATKVTKGDNYHLSAGIELLQAQKRIKAGEGNITWHGFLSDYCGGLSRSRAYELMRIARGKTTIEAVRERARKGMAASRARTRTRTQARTQSHERGRERPHMRAGVRNVTDSGPFKTNRLQAALDAYDELTSDEREQFKRARHLVDADEPWEGSVH